MYVWCCRVTDEFMEMNGLTLICRAHQLVQENNRMLHTFNIDTPKHLKRMEEIEIEYDFNFPRLPKSTSFSIGN